MTVTVTFPISLEVKLVIELTQTFTFVMPRFRRSKSSSNTSPPTPTPPTPTPPVKLVRKLTSQRESTALAATSSAIALSISSAFSGADDTSSGGVTNQEGDTGWKTAYAAVRMAIEVTKESSDLCLPLKAVVGAMSVLTKNYDVSVSCLLALSTL